MQSRPFSTLSLSTLCSPSSVYKEKPMGILVIGAVFVDIKGYPLDKYIPGGRNV